ncbi:MAG: hypothetical protein ACRDKT_07570 [Actinomycetota bacterium]
MDAAVTTEEPTVEKEKKGLGRVALPALVAALVIALSAAGAFAFLWVRDSETDAADVDTYLSSEASAVDRTATRVVTLLSNYDATNIDAVVEEMLSITTGSFRKDYEETFEAGFGDAIKEASTSARGEILSGPDISFRSGDEAVAVVRVSQTIQNNRNPAGRTYVDVMQLTLIKTSSGEWKADRVEILGGQET